MNEQFVKDIFDTLVNDSTNTYKELFDSTVINEKTVDYWKNSLMLYNSLDQNQKRIFLRVIKQITIDTISSIFSVFDGVSALKEHGCYDVKVTINGEDTENELQDSFLEYIEPFLNDIK